MSKRTKNTIINLVGWYGAVAELAAYFLVSFAVVKPNSLEYQLLNLSGAIGLGTICYYKKAYQPFFVNVIWALIAIAGITDLLFLVNVH